MELIYLMVSTYFPTPEEPWRCSFVYDQVRAIQKILDKYEVVVLKPNYDGTYQFRGVRVIGFMYRMTGTWVNPWLMNRHNVRMMWKALDDAGISAGDIAVAHGQLVPMATYLDAIKRRNSNVRTILQFQDPDPYGMLFGSGRIGTFKKMMYFWYYRGLVEKMGRLVGISRNVSKVVSEAPHQTVYNTYEPMRMAMQALRRFRCARVRSAYTLHNGVDRAIFSSEGRSVDARYFTIGCVAVFRDWKDQLSLVRAVAKIRDKIPNLRVKLAGVRHSGTMLEDCRRCIAENKLPVEIIGSMDHTALPGFYRSLDLFVLPSFFEGFGCVFTEAWSCGTPFITCEGQAMDDLIYPEDRELWLCKQQDPDDLAEKILCFYKKRSEQRLSGLVDIVELNRAFLEEERII